MNNPVRNHGFTLIEVMVVISIVAVLLYFSVPVFHSFSKGSDTQKNVTELTGLIQSLKQAAVNEKKDYFLNIDPGTGRVFVTIEGMDKAIIDPAENTGLDNLKHLMIIDVEFPGIRESLFLPVRFSKEGYSDMALIHIRIEGKEITLKIEPFLSLVEQENRYVSYHDCM